MEASKSTSSEDFELAKELCSQFLQGNWINRDLVDTKLLSGGYCSKLILCSLRDVDSGGDRFRQVIVRFITRIFPMVVAGEAGEALAMQSLWEAGVGPKLLGVFPGGKSPLCVLANCNVESMRENKTQSDE